MVQWIRTLVALPKDQGSIPASIWWFTTTCVPYSRGPDMLFWSPWALGMQVVHRHVCRQNIHKHKIKLISKLKKMILTLIYKLKKVNKIKGPTVISGLVSKGISLDASSLTSGQCSS